MDEFSTRLQALSSDKRELLEIFLKEKKLQTPWLLASYVAPRTACEAALAEIWMQVLGVERVGVEDDFFELGGDSILSIQVIAKAAEIGLSLHRNQLFEHPTIAELAPLAGDVRRRQEADEPGPVPLAPAQAALLGARRQSAGRAVLLQLAEPDGGRLALAARCLVEEHAALRLRYERAASGWRQTLGADAEPTVDQQDLSRLAPAEQAAAAAASVRGLQAGWDPDRGAAPLRLRLLPCGAGRPAFVALAVPALVCDEESLRILVDDLRAAYAQLGLGQRVALPPPSTSFPRWCREISRHAASAELANELSWWEEQSAAAPPLPLDRAPAATPPPPLRPVPAVAVVLDPDASRQLLQDIPARHRIQVVELLLAALARTVSACTGSTSIRFDVTGSARGESVLGMDLSRTVGACEFVFPVRLSVAAGATGAAAMADLKALKQQLRAIPGGGLGYALLAGAAGTAAAERLRSRPRAQLLVSFRSSFATTWERPAAILSLAGEPLAQAPWASAPYPLWLAAGAAGGQVRLSFTYDPGCFDRSTVERLARQLEQQLRRLIAEAGSGATALAAADFPDAELGADDLDRLFAMP
jgi:non-ribosomal peptide synthase protein (TIGR01720 family)